MVKDYKLIDLLNREEMYEGITNIVLLDHRIINDAKKGSLHKGHIEFDIGVEYERDGFTKLKGIECLLQQRTHNMLQENDFLYRIVFETNIEAVTKSKKKIMDMHPEAKEEDIMVGTFDSYDESVRFTVKQEIRNLEKEAETKMYQRSNVPKESVCYISFLKKENFYLCNSPGGYLWSQYKIDFTDVFDVRFEHVKDYVVSAGRSLDYDMKSNTLKKG